jgi:hypothetical protein
MRSLPPTVWWRAASPRHGTHPRWSARVGATPPLSRGCGHGNGVEWPLSWGQQDRHAGMHSGRAGWACTGGVKRPSRGVSSGQRTTYEARLVALRGLLLQATRRARTRWRRAAWLSVHTAAASGREERLCAYGRRAPYDHVHGPLAHRWISTRHALIRAGAEPGAPLRAFCGDGPVCTGACTRDAGTHRGDRQRRHARIAPVPRRVSPATCPQPSSPLPTEGPTRARPSLSTRRESPPLVWASAAGGGGLSPVTCPLANAVPPSSVPSLLRPVLCCMIGSFPPSASPRACLPHGPLAPAYAGTACSLPPKPRGGRRRLSKPTRNGGPPSVSTGKGVRASDSRGGQGGHGEGREGKGGRGGNLGHAVEEFSPEVVHPRLRQGRAEAARRYKGEGQGEVGGE